MEELLNEPMNLVMTFILVPPKRRSRFWKSIIALKISAAKIGEKRRRNVNFAVSQLPQQKI